VCFVTGLANNLKNQTVESPRRKPPQVYRFTKQLNNHKKTGRPEKDGRIKIIHLNVEMTI